MIGSLQRGSEAAAAEAAGAGTERAEVRGRRGAARLGGREQRQFVDLPHGLVEPDDERGDVAQGHCLHALEVARDGAAHALQAGLVVARQALLGLLERGHQRLGAAGDGALLHGHADRGFDVAEHGSRRASATATGSAPRAACAAARLRPPAPPAARPWPRHRALHPPRRARACAPRWTRPGSSAAAARARAPASARASACSRPWPAPQARRWPAPAQARRTSAAPAATARAAPMRPPAARRAVSRAERNRRSRCGGL